MSEITKLEIQHVAELAKIQVNEAETEALRDKISNILGLVEKMQSINTDNVEPMAHAIYQNQKLREDISTLNDQRDRYQSLSQKTDGGFYLVPKVIE